MRNLITDIPGLRVGHAQDERLASGVTTLIFDSPTIASISIQGGAPGVRDAALLEPDMTVEGVDALVLSGGSAFGLDSMGGVQGALREQGRGFAVGQFLIPIVPGAILFDLGNGGDKDWGRMPPYWDLGYASAVAASVDFALGSVGAGLGATTADLKGGLGSTSAVTPSGFTVGALVVVNALGQTTIGDGPYFWAATFEREAEFGGLGMPASWPANGHLRVKGHTPQNTTIAIVATDAAMTKAQCKRLAVMAHDGMARAIRPSHAALDGDVVFAAATGGTAKEAPTLHQLTEIGALAADCLARAIARAVFEATSLPFDRALPSWRQRFRQET
ncbi:P1 family peptidase [Lichenifustis flavocetrariae]|uniref:P1 family peptidase n=1 Tax=Lichenifustis flavocetrariae TaxID=2949735 RepID=A0AA42CJ95_9HYPH|nr:P1 family peptidase [Lichenifustis flavocetrariae]MCW6509348.1 P1 family peptidase [Lichenifustis flavocetrariae]